MNVNSVGSHHHHMHFGMTGGSQQQPSLSNTAQLLGLSSDQLQSALQSGGTLGSLASSKGVPSSDLLASVEKDLQANTPQGAPTLSGSQLQQIATSIINGTQPTPPAGGGGGFGGTMSFGGLGAQQSAGFGGQAPSFSNTAQLLGISTDELATDLQSGQTFSELGNAKGVSRSDLIASVEKDLTGDSSDSDNGTASVPQLSGDQLQELAGNIVDGVLPTPQSWRSDGTGTGGNFVDWYA